MGDALPDGQSCYGFGNGGDAGMVNQTPLNEGPNQGDGRSRVAEEPRRPFRRGVGDLAHDVTTLVELQAQLFSLEMKQAFRRLVSPAVLLVLGTVFLLAALPVLLAAFAMFLIEVANLSQIPAYLIAAGAGLLLGAFALAVAALQIRNLSSIFDRSQNELKENLHWVKHLLKRGGQP